MSIFFWGGGLFLDRITVINITNIDMAILNIIVAFGNINNNLKLFISMSINIRLFRGITFVLRGITSQIL